MAAKSSGRTYSGSRSYSQSSSRSKAKSSDNVIAKFFGKVQEVFSESVQVAKDETQRFDQVLFALIVILVIVGTLMMFSASYAYAYYKYEGDSTFFLRKQAAFAVVGVIAMVIVSFVPAIKLKGMLVWMLPLSYFMLVMVFFAEARNGAHRWIFGFQPSEFTKFVIILFCAYWADKYNREMSTFKKGVLPFLAVIGSTAALLFFEPHVSCMIIIILLGGTIMLIGGMRLSWFFSVVGIGVLAVVGVLVFRPALEDIHFFARIYGRIDVFIDPFKDPTGDGWQNIQSLYAISSGGLTGQGVGNSRQKYLYISEPQNDFVFAVVCEELGFVGAVVIILLFMILVWRGFSISLNNTNRFCRLLGIGITAQVGWQALLNIMVVTKMAPNTGISLPFFSYGGTSLVMLLLEMGVLLSISRKSSIKV